MRATSLLLLAAAGVATVAVALEVSRRTSATPTGPTVEPPAPGPEGSGADPWGSGDWGAVDFGVDVYPAGLDPLPMGPPATPESASASPDCAAVAVGEDWWPVAVSAAIAKINAGDSREDALAAVAYELLPVGCDTADTYGAATLRAELRMRVARARIQTSYTRPGAPSSSSPVWQPLPPAPPNIPPPGNPSGGGWTPFDGNPARVAGSSRRQIGLRDAIASLLTGVPGGGYA